MGEEFQIDPIYIDGPYGLPVNRFKDAGDSAAEFFTIACLTKNFTRKWSYYQGVTPLRHPNANYWWGLPERFSRDQFIPVLCAVLNNPESNEAFACSHWFWGQHRSKGFLFAWNKFSNGPRPRRKTPDFTGPEVWGLWARIWAEKFSFTRFFFLCFCDLETLISAIHWRLGRKDQVTRNHMLSTLMSYKHLPTPISVLAYKITPWPKLIEKWSRHCQDVYAIDTSYLFAKEVDYLNYIK